MTAPLSISSARPGMSVADFAQRHGFCLSYALKLCRHGRVFGARQHPLTRRWWVYPPAKLLKP